MKRGSNNINNIFKEGLDNFEMPPSDRVWSNIETALFPEHKAVPVYRKRWFIASILLLLFGIGGWLFIGNDNIHKQVSNQVSIEKSGNQVSTYQKPTLSTKKAQNESYSNDNSNPATATINAHSSHSAPNITTQKKDIELTTVNDKNIKTQMATLTEAMFTQKNNILESLPLANIYTLAILPSTGLMEQNRKTLTVEQYITKRDKLHIYTGVVAEAGAIYYPATEDRFTWATEASIGVKAEKFYFETGIGYRFVDERGSYKIDFRTQDSVGYYNHVTSFDIDPQNPDKIVLNYKKTTVFDSVDHIAYTAPLYKYDYITLPLRVGYRFFNKKNIFVSLEAGVEYSYLARSFIPESDFYYEGSDVVKIVNQTPVRVTNNWKYLLSVRVGIRLNKSITIAAQPEFSKYVNSVYTNGSDGKVLKPYMMNLRIGIYFDF